MSLAFSGRLNQYRRGKRKTSAKTSAKCPWRHIGETSEKRAEKPPFRAVFYGVKSKSDRIRKDKDKIVVINSL